MANAPAANRIKTSLRIYGKKVEVRHRHLDALWYSSGGQQLLRIVVVRDPSEKRRDDCFFSTDTSLSARKIVELFCLRWPLEACFHEVKQLLGFEDPPNRVSQATLRTALYLRSNFVVVCADRLQTGGRFRRRTPLVQ